MRLHKTPAILAAALGLALTATPATAQPKLLVLPYQPIYRSVPQDKAQALSQLLTRELKRHPRLALTAGAEPAARSAARRPPLGAEAAATEQARDIQAALKLRQAALDALLRHPAQASAGAILSAELRLARAAMWAGEDARSKAALEAAAAMRPNAELPPADYSRLFSRWFSAAAARVRARGTARIVIDSALPGAEISLDGRRLGVAPLRLRGILTGQHLLTAKLGRLPRAGAILNLKPGDNPKFTLGARAQGGASIGADVAGNQITATTLARAVRAGQAAGAQFVLLGGLASAESSYRAYPFLVEVQSGRLAKLKPVDFDKELLTAESDLLGVVRQVEATTAKFAGDRRPVAKIAAGFGAGRAVRTVDASPAAPARQGKKKKRGPRKVYRAQSGGTIQIKDEDD